MVLKTLIVTQIVKKFPAFYENRIFVTVFTGAPYSKFRVR